MNFEQVIEFLNKPETAEEVLRVLESESKLPANVVIAGGAVANTIYNMIYGTGAPINDIDIYLPVVGTSNIARTRIEKNEPNRLFNIMLKQNDHDDYIGITVTSGNGFGYRIIGTNRIGKLNIINFTPVVGGSADLSKADWTRIVIRGFDLNCCQASIHTTERKIRFTAAFVQFLVDRQIKVESAFNPSSTVVRIFKKRDELKAYLDVQRECKHLQFVLANFGTNKIVSTFISEEKANRSQEYPEIFQYFELKKSIKTFIVDPNDVRMLRSRMDKQELEGLTNVEVEKTEIYEFTSKNPVPVPEFANLRFTSYREFYNAWNRAYGFRKKEHDRAKFLEVIQYKALVKFCVTRDDYLVRDYKKDKLEALNKFMIEHVRMFKWFEHSDLCGQLETFALISKYSENLELIGELENFGRNQLWEDILERRKEMFQLTEPVILKLLSNHKNKDVDEKYIDALDINIQGVKELTTKFELRKEGSEMNHCVGGYGGEISGGLLRIFSISTSSGPKGRSTVSIYTPTENTSWKVQQHQAEYNGLPSPANYILVDKLLNELNLRFNPHREKYLTELFKQVGYDTCIEILAKINQKEAIPA